MTGSHTTVHIPDEAVQAAIENLKINQTQLDADGCMVGVSRQALDEVLSALPHLSAPCAVEVDKLHWDGFVGFVGSFTYVVAPPSFTKGYRVWGKLSGKSNSIGMALITTTAADEEEAKAAAQADFERRILSCVVTKPVDVAAVREAEAVIERNGEEVTAAAMISVIADFLRTNGKAVLLSENSFGKQILEFKLAAENLRALSAEPAQGARALEEWHEDHGDVVWWAWDENRKEWLGEPAHIGTPIDSAWPAYHTHWTPHPLRPAVPTTEAGK